MKIIPLFVAAAVFAGSCHPATAAISDNIKHFHLSGQNDSGQTGTVTMLGEGDMTIVRVRVANPGADPEPAHIHTGGCAKLNPKPAYALAPLVGGVSETKVMQPIGALVGHGFAVNVHKSAKEASVYVSCGDLT